MKNSTDTAPVATDRLKRTLLMLILALAFLGSAVAWTLMELSGEASPTLRVIFGLNVLFQPIVFFSVWLRRLTLHIADLACLIFAVCICATCMALRFYSPSYGASVDLQPLYLWIPVIYVFAFTMPNHKTSLTLSLVIMAIFVAISLPYLIRHFDQPNCNFTIQLHLVSGVMVTALYFFSSYLHRFRTAELTAEELARIANTDELTQLANRRRMAEGIEAELHRFARYGHPFSIILIDIDHFKSINDRFGHRAGDETLVALAKRTTDVLRDVDTLGRWGGEEFLVILPETGFDETLRKAHALCEQIAAAPLFREHVVTISCGVASVSASDTADTLLQRADVALYSAKDRGRNRAEGLNERPPDPTTFQLAPINAA